MRTIKQNLEDGIKVLKEGNTFDKVNALGTILMDLTQIKGFNPIPIEAMAVAKNILFQRTIRIRQVGILKYAVIRWRNLKMKLRLKLALKEAKKYTYGDGDKYVQEILDLIRKNI
jgi:hypothetical protein